MAESYGNTVLFVFQLESLYSQCIKANDELFHMALYEWMVKNDLTDKLLQVCKHYF